MQKEELRRMIERQTERFQGIYGGEVVRYASPQNPNKIKLDTCKAPPNLKQAEWETYLEQVKNGTYHPDTNYQVRPASKKNVRLDDYAL